MVALVVPVMLASCVEGDNSSPLTTHVTRGAACSSETSSYYDGLHGSEEKVSQSSDEGSGLVSSVTHYGPDEFTNTRDALNVTDCNNGDVMRIVSASKPLPAYATEENVDFAPDDFVAKARKSGALVSLATLQNYAGRRGYTYMSNRPNVCGCKLYYPSLEGAGLAVAN